MTINVGDKVRVGTQVGEVIKIEQFGESIQYRIYFSDGLRSIFSPPTEIEKINSPVEMIKNLQFGDAYRFDLLTEATRLSLAYEYDHLLSLSSTRTFLEPYQVEAVYKVLSAFKQRFLIADDVGLGKTIEGGMIMKELIARGRGNRILITVPASLQLQWKNEMYERFDENFVIYNSAFVNPLRDSLPKDANVWEHYNKIITSLDYAKQENVKAELRRATWNLIVFDEAHKLSNPKGSGKTLRYKLGESIKDQADNLLLLTATPHSGDSFAFYSIIRLIDPYIFKDPESISPDKLQRVMIRRGKKGIKDSEGKPVFKDRIVKSVPIEYSKKEQELYEAVTEYVKHEYNLAQKQGNRAYGFAMIILQKRMASSIYAITNSLKNRLEKILGKVHTDLNEDEIRLLRRYYEGKEENEQFGMEDLDPVEIEMLERKLETMTLDKTPAEFQIEIDKLKELIKLAEKTDVDTKAETVVNFIVETLKKDTKEKILVFTEYKDTLNYLNEKIKGEKINGKSIETAIIHGDIKVGPERKVQEEKFKDPNVNVMVATEAAGEGINLQFCHIMINNDLPWNPNRIDQRIGRLHRYLQKKDVYVHNLVTTTTREGKIFLRLIEKISIIEKQLGGSVSNILGTLLRDVNLEQLIMEALSKEKPIEVSLRDIEDATQRSLDAYIKMDEKLLMSFKKFDLDSIMKVIEKSREKTVTEKDIENFVRIFFTNFGGLIEKTRFKDIYRLTVPKVLVNEQVKNVYEQVTFLKEVAKEKYPSDVEFIAFGHPLLTYMIDFCKKRDEYFGGGATVKIADAVTSGIIFNFILRYLDAKGTVISENFLPVFVDKNGKPASDLSNLILKTDKPAINLVQKKEDYLTSKINELERVALDYANESSRRHIKKIKEKREREVRIKKEDIEKYFGARLTLEKKRLTEYMKKGITGEDMKIAIRGRESVIKELETEHEKALNNLEQEQNIYAEAPALLNACLILNINDK